MLENGSALSALRADEAPAGVGTQQPRFQAIDFHDDDRFLDRIERRPAAFQYPPTRSHGVAHTVEMSFHHVIWNGPGAAMND